MQIIMDINKVNQEMNWVIKLVKSVESKAQLDTALKCFFLWELKHNLNDCKNSITSPLKSKFWAIYKTKESQFSLCNPIIS